MELSDLGYKSLRIELIDLVYIETTIRHHKYQNPKNKGKKNVYEISTISTPECSKIPRVHSAAGEVNNKA